jgi:hypothetical protein
MQAVLGEFVRRNVTPNDAGRDGITQQPTHHQPQLPLGMTVTLMMVMEKGCELGVTEPWGFVLFLRHEGSSPGPPSAQACFTYSSVMLGDAEM